MSFKVISTILVDEHEDTQGLAAAIALAERMGAHLDIFVVAVTHPDANSYYLGAEAVLIAEHTRDAIARRQDLEKWVTDRMQGEVVPWAVSGATVQSVGLSGYLARKLRFSDLVVLPRPYEGQNGDNIASLVEACLFGAERPVMMIPKGASLPALDGKILMGWNNAAEALSAARAAMPLMQQASEVDICIVDPPKHAPDRSDPGGELAQYLMRHGAHTAVSVVAKTEPHIGDILVRRASENGVDLIVAGAYGHSRLREAVFGGATRQLLASATCPIFMSR